MTRIEWWERILGLGSPTLPALVAHCVDAAKGFETISWSECLAPTAHAKNESGH